MSEFGPRPAHEGAAANLRCLAVAHERFRPQIDDGISRALATHTDIDGDTARCIAHVLGRALGRSSHLAEYARTGTARYVDLREEYLDLYGNDELDSGTRELIDWLGVHLIGQVGIGSGRQFMNETLPPKLQQILVADTVTVRGERVRVHVPGTTGHTGLAGLSESLVNLNLHRDPALQAFLSLSDVNALSDNVLESFEATFAGSFRDYGEALRALSPLEDWQKSLADWQIDNGVDTDALKWNFGPLYEHLRNVYDLVERKGMLHAFNK